MIEFLKGPNAAFVTLGIPLFMYAIQSVVYFIAMGRYGMALAFSSYALANVGFILDAKGI